MDVEIVKSNGQKFRLSDYGVVQDFVVNSIDRSVTRESVDGRKGSVDYGTNIGDRSISVPMIFKASDLHDYAHLRDELFGILDDDEPFYIREMRRKDYLQYEFVDFGQSPTWSNGVENEYVNGKNYKVRLDSSISPEQWDDKPNGDITIEFVTSGLPFAESIYTTLELHDSGYSATVEKYGLVDNIDDEKVKYRFTEKNFTVYNAGNVIIEPESMLLSIIVNAVQSDNNFTIRNKTTGEEIVLKRASAGSHFRIQGMVISLGSITNIFRDTNRRFISLVPGDNQFEILNGTFEEIRFEFKYLYK